MKTKILLRILALFLLAAIMQKTIAGNKAGKISFIDYINSYRDTTPPSSVANNFLTVTTNENTTTGQGTVLCNGCTTLPDTTKLEIKHPNIRFVIKDIVKVVVSQDSIVIDDIGNNYHKRILISNNLNLKIIYDLNATPVIKNATEISKPNDQQAQQAANTTAGIKKADQ